MFFVFHRTIAFLLKLRELEDGKIERRFHPVMPEKTGKNRLKEWEKAVVRANDWTS